MIKNTDDLTSPSRPFADRLRLFRDGRGLTRADLAADLGVTPITLYRWETGSTRPSPLAAERLRLLGFGDVADEETNVTSIPRLKTAASGSRLNMAAADLREAGRRVFSHLGVSHKVLLSPFVRNGPPDQMAFHDRLINMQASDRIPQQSLLRRLSMVEEVENFGHTSQHKLEKPKAAALAWNSNYGSHGWHRYVGRFPPHVVRALLNHFGANSDSLVCDPFVGSGTTAVECRLLGIPFVGIEICPLSAMLTRTKAAFPETPGLLTNLANDFTSFYSRAWLQFVGARTAGSISHSEILERSGNQIPVFKNIERWFTPEALLGVSIAVQYAMTLSGFKREAVLTALSAKMRSIGNVEVDVVRAEYSKNPRENVDVCQTVFRQLGKMGANIASSISTHEGLLGEPSKVQVIEGSVLDAKLPESSVDCIVTSPPYGVEAISYLRTHLLSYRALAPHLGHDPYETRDKTIGSEYLTDSVENAGLQSQQCSSTCRSFFSSGAREKDPKFDQRRSAMMQFCDDMLTVADRMSAWLKRRGNVAFIIGNKRLGERVIPMNAIVTELFKTRSLSLQNEIKHKLKTNNSNSQVPWQERVIQEEAILIFRRD